jgi:hypothetical protein
MLFYAGKYLSGWVGGFVTALLALFSAGLVQAAHFLTVESLIGFFGLSITLLFILRLPSKVIAVALPVLLGLGIGTKISFFPFTLSYLLLIWKFREMKAPWVKIVAALVGGALLTTAVFIAINPMIVIKGKEVLSGLSFASKVADGRMPVFWTRPFVGTIPLLYQIIHVFPYITSWLFFPFMLIGYFFSLKTNRNLLFMTLIAFLLFAPFFSKWTRYVIQVLPVLILIAGVGAGWIWKKGRLGKIIVVLTLVSFLPQFFYILRVYGGEDNRVAAAKWAEVNISKDARIFTEAMDLGILPFNPTHGQNIELFNFYELDEVWAKEKQEKLDTLIDESDYFILLSRRVYKNSLDRPDKFPRSARFYRSLFDGSLGYKKIYESTPDSLLAEETFEVFDNPKVMIFENMKKD